MNLAGLYKAYQVFLIFWKVLPIVNQAVLAVEQVFPAGGQGAEKLAQVHDWIQALYDKIEGAKADYADVWALIEPWVKKLVAKYNAQGWPSADPAEAPVA